MGQLAVTFSMSMRLSSSTWSELYPFTQGLGKKLTACDSVESSAQEFARSLFDAFTESLVLARVYVSLPLEDLAPEVRTFAEAVATGKGLSAKMKSSTPVLCLMGTYGQQTVWRQRKLSQGHQGIPLASAEFVDSVPMLARLFRDTGVSQQVLQDFDGGVDIQRDVVNGLFYVADAQKTVDAQGRLVIPAQDFVIKHGVKTVFGGGGLFVNGSFGAFILFTREDVSHAAAERVNSLLSVFKVAAGAKLANRKLYSARD